jgi:hypothetical protein
VGLLYGERIAVQRSFFLPAKKTDGFHANVSLIRCASTGPRRFFPTECTLPWNAHWSAVLCGYRVSAI